MSGRIERDGLVTAAVEYKKKGNGSRGGGGEANRHCRKGIPMIAPSNFTSVTRSSRGF